MVDGDHAIVLSEIIAGEGRGITGKQILAALNKSRRLDADHLRFTEQNTRQFLERYDIALFGEAPQSRDRTDLCKVGNEVLCKWQRTGETPQSGEEGFDCFQKTGYGFCPKMQQKRRTPDASGRLEKGGAAERRRVMQLRSKLTRLADDFGPSFASEDGLIRTLGGGRGYAIAATVKYRDD